MNLYSAVKLPVLALRQINFCIWHSGRCGSSVLTSMLTQHPNIFCAGELLETYSNQYIEVSDKSKAWSGGKLRIARNALRGGRKTSGFEMKVWHLVRLGVSVTQAMQFVNQIGYNKHIVLERKNYLRAMASGHVLKKTSTSHIGSKSQAQLNQVHIDSETLFPRLETFSNFYSDVKALLGDDCLWLYYEDDIHKDPKVACNKVTDYLNVNRQDPNIRLGITNPYPLNEIISNYDEISTMLKDTNYEWMLTR